MPAELYIGLMSGTSLDGIDAALVDMSRGIPHCTATHFLPFADDLRAEALAIQAPGANELHRAALLGNRLADEYARAVKALLKASGVERTQIRAIGCHGQTVRHVPAAGYTLQLGNPARLAETTGIAVIADFRSRDIAAGGQGAPLVPAFHDAVFRSKDHHRIILNVGGIANVTNLAPGKSVVGFDCGPGNMLMDAWVNRHLGKAWDENGDWARSGTVLPDLLAQLLRHPYFAAPPPKSCGREEFGIAFLEPHLREGWRPEDVQATLLALTVKATANAIEHWCGAPAELYFCGGGARNTALMNGLQTAMPQTIVAATDVLGLPVDWVEAVAFAWLAGRTLHGLPGNLPEVTGATGPRILGAIYPA